MRKFELRILTNADLHANTSLLDLKVIFTGSLEECQKWAEKEGYRWKSDSKLLFGGYFVHSNGNCLFTT